MFVADLLPVTAVLGPTNTGKTHYALERMWAHESGVFGCPLRLLARELYERTVAARGVDSAALITGEERIMPAGARYRICTVEAMPRDTDAAFVAIDEVQLMADRERGHVFTDRVLHLRGRYETLLLGAETVRPLLRALLGERLRFMTRPRFSQLRYVGVQKLQHMPRRSAVIAFSTEEVYALAELLRRHRGGTAVITGALSPRARNAQAELFRNGEVDFLAATDAVGMGLNLDVAHVVFAAAEKFDGDAPRRLRDDELAQIAGRAGRYTQEGTFAVLQDVYLGEDTVRAIEDHRFEPVRAAFWRNRQLNFASSAALIASLETPSGSPLLRRSPQGDDGRTLRALLGDADICADTPQTLRLLWDVASIPDFTKHYNSDHYGVVKKVYTDLRYKGKVDSESFAARLQRLNEPEGDLHTLSARIAGVRTLSFVAHRQDWLPEAEGFRARSRAVEDRLSDALHAALTARFVDRRTASLMRKLHLREMMVTDIAASGLVCLEGRPIGRLCGFMFLPAEDFSPEERRLGESALSDALNIELRTRLRALVDSHEKSVQLSDEGLLVYADEPVGRLMAGPDVLHPTVVPIIDARAPQALVNELKTHLENRFARYRDTVLADLLALKSSPDLQGFARGFAFSLFEAGGVARRADALEELSALSAEDREVLRKLRVRFGEHFIFLSEVLRPAAVRLKLILQAVLAGVQPTLPPEAGVPAPKVRGDEPAGYWDVCGYVACGTRAVRCDMVEKLADALRQPARRSLSNPEGEFVVTAEMMSIVGRSGEDFAEILRALDYDTREKVDAATGETAVVWFRKPPRRHAAKPAPQAAQRLPRERRENREQLERAQQGYAAATGEASAAVPAPRKHQRIEVRREPSEAPREVDPDNPFAVLANYFSDR